MFPKWGENKLRENVKNMDSDGFDLLQVLYESKIEIFWDTLKTGLILGLLVLSSWNSRYYIMIQVNEWLHELRIDNTIILKI